MQIPIKVINKEERISVRCEALIREIKIYDNSLYPAS